MKSYPVSNVLNIRIHKISKKDLEKEIVSALRSEEELFIATVNPSFIIRSRKDKEFEKILNKETNLNVADGIGLRLVDKHLEIIPGVDIVTKILSFAEDLGKTVLIVVKEDSLTSKDRLNSYLRTKYPSLRFTISVPERFKSTYDVLLCTLGEVVQEKFIYNNLHTIKPKISIGVGGAFDVLTGSVFVPKTKYFGWLFRLLSNPRRFPKIMQSVVLFPLMVFVERTRCALNKRGVL